MTSYRTKSNMENHRKMQLKHGTTSEPLSKGILTVVGLTCNTITLFVENKAMAIADRTIEAAMAAFEVLCPNDPTIQSKRAKMKRGMGLSFMECHLTPIVPDRESHKRHDYPKIKSHSIPGCHGDNRQSKCAEKKSSTVDFHDYGQELDRWMGECQDLSNVVKSLNECPDSLKIVLGQSNDVLDRYRRS